MKTASRLDHIFGGVIAQVLSLAILAWFAFEWWNGRLHWVLLALPAVLLLRVDQSRKRVVADKDWASARTSRRAIGQRGQGSPPAPRFSAALMDYVVVYPGLLLSGFLLAAYFISDAATRQASTPVGYGAGAAFGALALLAIWRKKKSSPPDMTATTPSDAAIAANYPPLCVTCVVPLLSPVPSFLDGIPELPEGLQRLVINGFKEQRFKREQGDHQ